MKAAGSAAEPLSPVVHGKLSSVNFGLLLAAAAIDGADMQLLPASFRALEADLGFTPLNLSWLAMAQTFFQASMAPIWGSLTDSGNISTKRLLGGAVGGWGFLTVLLGLSSSFQTMLIIRILIGVCLASLMPISQATVARHIAPAERGSKFGIVGAFWMLGQASSILVATAVSTDAFFLNGGLVLGWRIAFLTVGMGSMGLAIVIGLFYESPEEPLVQRTELLSAGEVVADVFRRAKPYFQIPTFRIIVLQELFGTVPWCALGFLTMYLQYVGFQNKLAGLLVSIMMLGMIPGNIFGGFIGDFAASISKLHGRIVVSQISIITGVPAMVILFQVLPPDATHFMWFALVLGCFGFFNTWCMAGTKRPMLSEIVKPGDWASLLALDTAFEGCSGAMFGAPLVGFLAQNAFGYIPTSGHLSAMPAGLRTANREALGKGLLIMTTIPWTICWLNWTILHYAYPKDLAAAEAIQGEGDEEGYGDREDAPLLPAHDDGCTTST